MGRGRVQLKGDRGQDQPPSQLLQAPLWSFEDRSEITVICDAEVALIVFSTKEEVTEYSTDSRVYLRILCHRRSGRVSQTPEKRRSLMQYLFTHTSERLQANKQLKLEMIPSVSPPYEMKIQESAKSSQKRSTMHLMFHNFGDESDEISPILATLLVSQVIFGNRSLHLARENGDLELVEQLILLDRNLCLRKDSSGMIPLHVAIEKSKGEVGVINLILKYYPESAIEVTATTMETYLDVAIRHNKTDVVVHLLNWIILERPDFRYLLNCRDYEGNTAMEISTLQNGPYEMKKIDELRAALELYLKLDEFRDQDCRAIGICEMGGIGKTTIAKAVYNHKARLEWARFFDNSLLHLACKDGNLKLVEQLILLDRNWCLTKDWFGEMPLHIAAKNGKVDVINLILKYCPESVEEVTATTMETCFDLAIRHNKIEVVVHLLNWIIWERPDFRYLLNCRDNEGDRALQFYFSSKLLKSIGVLHSGKLSDANALNSGGSMALGTSYYLPHSEKVDIVTDKILHKPRDTGLSNNSGALCSDVYSQEGGTFSPSYITTFTSIGFRIGLLLTATLFATITYQVPFHLDDSTSKEGSKHDLIIWFNSVVFISSVGVIIFVLHEFPLKPWPHISISVVFGSFMFSLNAIMPDGTLVLLFISIPFLLVCFFGKTLWLCKLKFYWSI